MSAERLLMTPEQFQELAKQIAEHGIPPRWEEWVVLILLLIVGAALSAYVGAFFAKRGEMKAISRSLDTLLAETKALTLATGTINSNFSRLDWVEQKKWEIKQKYYWELISNLDLLSNAERNHINALKKFDQLTGATGTPGFTEKLTKNSQARKSAFVEMRKYRSEVDAASCYAGVILSSEIRKLYKEYVDRNMGAHDKDGIDFWEAGWKSTRQLFTAIKSAAEKDLQMNLHEGSNALATNRTMEQ